MARVEAGRGARLESIVVLLAVCEAGDTKRRTLSFLLDVALADWRTWLFRRKLVDRLPPLRKAG